jgi:hypothetical protein
MKKYMVHICNQVIAASTEEEAWAIIETFPFGSCYEVLDEKGNIRSEFIPF